MNIIDAKWAILGFQETNESRAFLTVARDQLTFAVDNILNVIRRLGRGNISTLLTSGKLDHTPAP